MSLRLEGLSKRYGDIQAVDRVSFELHPGETLALLGPSGCGKSTLLRLIAGLEPTDSGHIFLNGEEVTQRPPQKRGFGMVFQDYALFPHLNVEKNIAYGLVEKGWSKKEQRERVDHLLDLVGLSGYNRRRTSELSGGQQQRVALARSLAPEPPLLLLDEPLSNLDLALREDLKEQLHTLLSAFELSAIYVTHDQGEAFTLAERIAVMRSGRIVQLDDAANLYARPKTAWLARFLGHDNVYETLSHEGLRFLASTSVEKPYVLIRSDLTCLSSGEMSATLLSHVQVGAVHTLEFNLHPFDLRFYWRGFSREVPPTLEVGQTISLYIPKHAVVGLDGDGRTPADTRART